MFYFVGIRLLVPLAKLVFPFEIRGRENIPPTGRLIVCSNHKSLIDPFLLAVPFHRQIRYMAKSELFTDHGPLARRLLYQLGAFPVRRGRGDAESIKTAIQILNSGGIVGVFPQGKCVFDNSPFMPKAGAAMLALKTKSSVLPVSIYCDGVIKPFRRITVRIGKLIPFEELSRAGDGRRQIREASAIIADHINRQLEEKN